MIRSTAALLFVLATACSKPSPVERAAAVDGKPALVASAPSVAPAATPQAGARTCTLQKPVETFDDKAGATGEYGSEAAENVRLLAHERDVMVTWERQTHFNVGDPSRTPVAMYRHAAEPWKQTKLEVMAYACATYGYIAPARPSAESLGIVSWGQQNTTAFEGWTGLPGRSNKRERSLATRTEMLAGPFVLSGSTVLASTREGCDSVCDCQSNWQGLRLYDLDAKPRQSERVVKAEGADSLALTTSANGGALAYRHKKTLQLGWLDAQGKLQAPPQKLAEGDVGAPAMAMVGKKLLVVWAERTGKTAPYALKWSLLEHGAAPMPAQTFTTADSAFAPAVLVDGDAILLTWMEGDAQKRGRIRLKNLLTTAITADLTDALVVSGDDANARDPEIAGTAAKPYLVYTAITKKMGGGQVRFAELACQ